PFGRNRTPPLGPPGDHARVRAPRRGPRPARDSCSCVAWNACRARKSPRRRRTQPALQSPQKQSVACLFPCNILGIYVRVVAVLAQEVKMGTDLDRTQGTGQDESRQEVARVARAILLGKERERWEPSRACGCGEGMRSAERPTT